MAPDFAAASKFTMNMRVLIPILIFTCAASAQTKPCHEVRFSGEAGQGVGFSRSLGSGMVFRLIPMRAKEESDWAWFIISAIGADASVFEFQLSDSNWLLENGGFTDAFIGGAHTNLRELPQRRVRYFLLPLDHETLLKSRAASRQVEGGKGKEKLDALETLQKLSQAHLKFKVVDFRVGPGDPPKSVEWVRFDVAAVVPAEFELAEDLRSNDVPCPTIRPEVIQNILHPKRLEATVP